MHSSKSKIKESRIERKVSFILATAGIGKRMKLNYPKQFFEYKGEPLFYSSLKIAYDSKFIDEIIIVTNEDNLDYMKKFCIEKNMMDKIKKIIKGGLERQDSIYNALMEIENTDYVIIQDGVRPFLKEKYIEQTLQTLENTDYDGAIIGVKVKDTVKLIDVNNEIISTPVRDFIVLAHTPQSFKFGVLKEAHENAIKSKVLATDDSMLVERMGKKVKFICGDYDNIKITTQDDLKYLK